MSDNVSNYQQQYPTHRQHSTLRFIVDWGTTKLSIGLQVYPEGTDEPLNRIILPLGLREAVLPQQVGFVKRCGDQPWEFVWGDELAQILRKGKLGEDRIAVFDWLKVCLHSDDEHNPIELSIKARLTELGYPHGDSRWLIEEHLRHVYKIIPDALRKVLPHWTEAMFKTATYDYTFSVPESASPGAWRDMRDAAITAGFPNPHISSETESAAAWAVHRLYTSNVHHVGSLTTKKVNGEVIVSDGGGRDLSTVRFVVSGSVNDGARLSMESTGCSVGAECGPEVVLTRMFTDYVHDECSRRYGKDYLRRLGRSRISFDVFLKQNFKSYKGSFEDEEQRYITVSGTSQGQSDPLQEVTILVTSGKMMEWLDLAFERIIQTIGSIWSPNVKWMIFTGGLFRNAYLLRKICDHYGPLGISVDASGHDEYGFTDLSVVWGWLHRFDMSTSRVEIPLRFGWAFGQENYFYQSIHTDAVENPALKKVNSEGDEYVVDRWKWLVKPGTMSVNGKWEEEEHWNLFLVSNKRPTIGKFIYWTQAPIEDDEAIYDKDGNLRPGLHEWSQGMDHNIPLDVLEKYPLDELKTPRSTAGKNRIRVAKGKNRAEKDKTPSTLDHSGVPESSTQTTNNHPPLVEGEKWYRVWAKLTVCIEGYNVSMRWELAPPTSEYWNPRTKKRVFNPRKNCHLTRIGEEGIHDRDSTPLLQRGGKAGPLVSQGSVSSHSVSLSPSYAQAGSSKPLGIGLTSLNSQVGRSGSQSPASAASSFTEPMSPSDFQLASAHSTPTPEEARVPLQEPPQEPPFHSISPPAPVGLARRPTGQVKLASPSGRRQRLAAASSSSEPEDLAEILQEVAQMERGDTSKLSTGKLKSRRTTRSGSKRDLQEEDSVDVEMWEGSTEDESPQARRGGGKRRRVEDEYDIDYEPRTRRSGRA